MSDRAPLDADAVRHIATLARLGLSDDEVRLLAGQLTDVLRYVEQLGELDTAGVEPTHAAAGGGAWRPPGLRIELAEGDATAAAPAAVEGQFSVPKVIG
ncbi:MAG: Asp-tRNA(Asn)/Glu-tRNA(Gln) amidotransferase subunit GatC [Myxococcales bacterium]|nr:Asp-tRNA(Asn)/Glu-tRNA(Gln) amidotransferase subunit GatC [Myxococcales bacterium]